MSLYHKASSWNDSLDAWDTTVYYNDYYYVSIDVILCIYMPYLYSCSYLFPCMYRFPCQMLVQQIVPGRGF